MDVSWENLLRYGGATGSTLGEPIEGQKRPRRPVPTRKPPAGAANATQPVREATPRARRSPRYSANPVIARLAESRDISGPFAAEFFAQCLAAVAAAAYQDGSCWIPGIGTFKVVKTPQRKGRHPVTGETLTVPAGTKLVFKESVPRTGSRRGDGER